MNSTHLYWEEEEDKIVTYPEDTKFYFIYYKVNIKGTSCKSAHSFRGQALDTDHPLEWQKYMNKLGKGKYTVISWQTLSETEYTLYKDDIGNGI